MSYHIEFGQSRYEAFYQEFLMIDAETGDPLPSVGIDHQFKILGDVCDYGDWLTTGQIVASNSNGLIYATTQLGISAIKIPGKNFGSFGLPFDAWLDNGSDRSQPLRCALIAVPPNADDAKVIFTGTITFGESTMIPRLTLRATPYYPAQQIPSPNATQVKIQLGVDYDLIEAALPASAVDPARLTWSTGGPVTIGGPLSNVIQQTKNWNTAAMGLFLTAAASQLT